MTYIGRRNLHWVERWCKTFTWELLLMISILESSGLLLSCSHSLHVRIWFTKLTRNGTTIQCWWLLMSDLRQLGWWAWSSSVCSLSVIWNPFQIPFPAVTICPESKTNIDKFNLSTIIEMNMKNETLSEDEEILLEALAQICELGIIVPRNKSSARGNYIKKLREVQPDFVNISSARLIGGNLNFTDLFSETFTDEGVCFTFNMLDEKDLFKETLNKDLRMPQNNTTSNWSIFGYKETSDLLEIFEAQPTRIMGAGVPAGLFIRLGMRKKDADYSCKDTSGFKITFHAPDEIPKPQKHFYRIPFGVETLINIQPRKMSTSPNLEQYSPIQRQCYFRGEKRLAFFKHYNLENCKLECLTSELTQTSESHVCDLSSPQISRWGFVIAWSTQCRAVMEHRFAVLNPALKKQNRLGHLLWVIRAAQY